MIVNKNTEDKKKPSLRDRIVRWAKVTRLWIIVIVIAGGFSIYGIANVTKRISYSWYYKAMVRETVREMVKEGSLK